MKLRFVLSQHRRNSARGKVIGKKWIYLERYRFHRQCGPPQKARAALGETQSTDREKMRGMEIWVG